MANEREMAKYQMIIDFISANKMLYSDDIVAQSQLFLDKHLGVEMRANLTTLVDTITTDPIAFADYKIQEYENTIDQLMED